jgi:hypothetical protein
MNKLTREEVKIYLDHYLEDNSFSQYIYSTFMVINNHQISGSLVYRISSINNLGDSEIFEAVYKEKLCFEKKMCYISDFSPYGYDKNVYNVFQGNGAGKICMDYIFEDSIEKGVSLVSLHTINDRFVNKILFKNGFKEELNNRRNLLNLYYKIID